MIVDASGAGSGCLTVTVTCRGEDIPSTVTTGTDVSDMEVSFVPKYLETHLINVCFNGETVKGYNVLFVQLRQIINGHKSLRGDADHSKPHPMLSCRLLPPGELNGMII